MLLINKRQHLNSKNHSDETLQIMESHPKEKILSFIIKNSKRLRNNKVKVSAIVKRENELFGNLTLTKNIEFKLFDSLSTFFIEITHAKFTGNAGEQGFGEITQSHFVLTLISVHQKLISYLLFLRS